MKEQHYDKLKPTLETRIRCNVQQLSLHQAGVANSVQLQEEQQATRDEIRTFKEHQADFNTAIIHMVQDKTDGCLDDAATASQQ
jgi:hypothetical protein